MKIYKLLQLALKIYTAITFLSLPFIYLYPRKMPIFNYTITNFTMNAINNKKIAFLGIALAMVLLLAFTVREIKFRGILIPTICCLIFVVDVVNVIINTSNILSYLAIVFDVAFIVLFVLYFIKRIKKHIARRRK